MIRIRCAVLLALAATSFALAQADKPLLLQKPSLSRTEIVFAYASDLWIVGRDGGDARRLTAGVGIESDPVFSPDGQWVAFSGEYDGNVDVYVVPASGGIPRRLTYHPGADVAVGWTPDGKRVLFRSSRNSYSRFNRLFTVPLEGGLPSEVPLPMAEEGSFSPDGSRLAYVPLGRAFTIWKRYRGGRTTPIWIANLADGSVEKIPRENSNDFNPAWVGKTIYFLSDRNGPVTLFAYDTGSKKVTPVLRNAGMDLKSASAGPGAIVYEQFGSLLLLDLASGKTRPIEVRIAGDLPEVRPHFQKIDPRRIESASLSPTGVRAVFEARGEILTVPAEKGDLRNLTQTPNVAERDPAWSPDGQWIAYFSDESGNYALHLRHPSGMGQVQKINLGNPPSFFYRPTWSPDSKKIAYTDKRLNLWYVDLDKGAPVRVFQDTFTGPQQIFQAAWSPDSRWLAYTRQLRSHMRAVFLYSLETQQNHQVTDGMSDAADPVFDREGKYVYFTASTDAGPTLDTSMMSINRPVTRSAYLLVLRKDLPSPLAPESDEEKSPEEAKAEGSSAAAVEGPSAEKAPEKERPEKKQPPEPVRIDFDHIGQRILSLPIPARNYEKMAAGKAGTVYLLEAPAVTLEFSPDGPKLTLHKFELKTRKTAVLLENIGSFALSYNGEKVLYRRGEQWFIGSTATPAGSGEPSSPAGAKPAAEALKLDPLEVYVDPRAEWKQMYHEVWRNERDFFYDPNHHGLDLATAEKKYQPYLENIASRSDLNFLFEEMLGELSVGHLFVFGGDRPEVKKVKGGLLGADYHVENGRYRFARVYDGENWNPQLKAPLTQPGVNVAAGEYLLAVNGRALTAAENLFSYFENTAGKSVVLRVGPNPDERGSREVTVVPVESEAGLRNLAWIEENRRKVDQLSGGRLAYIYLPDTAYGGYTSFNRYFFSQAGKEGAVIDERFNGGGTNTDYILDYLRRTLMNFRTTRDGQDTTTPVSLIFGPKCMIINEYAGSGGDAMPWHFRQAGIGPLVGKRTWGGLVGFFGPNAPALMDGGFVTAPSRGFWTANGKWEVENHGVAPDVEVDLEPQAWRAGHDTQLEKAVAMTMESLRRNRPPRYEKPPYPIFDRRPELTAKGRENGRQADVPTDTSRRKSP